VLKDGRIIEQGTHPDLLVRGGMYAYLNQQQKLKEELVAVLS
jgi:ABC-type multidrug transport system fused ATPase/permease subunit